jgi:cytochrome c-type biogenesis protein CcmH
MIFWTIAALMIAAVAAALAVPLLRKQAAGTDAAEYDLEVYRDQLAELERDQGRGAISGDELAAARTEISRRILAADARKQNRAAQEPASGRAGMSILAGALVISLAVGAVLLYLQTGAPGTPDMPLAQRTDLPAPGEEDQRIRKQITELARAAETNPGDAGAWLRLADAHKSLGMFGDAVAAYRKAISLGPVAAGINNDFAEALVMAAQGTVTPEARAIFEAELANFPGDPRPQFYLALGDYQAGRPREALDRWAALIAATPADAPWLGVVREHLVQAAEDLGEDVAKVMPEPLPAPGGNGAPQLTPEQRAEVEAMTPAERDAMIRDMVDGLDARLRDNPMEPEGWERLIRARVMLGERDAAQDALDRALEAFAQAPAPTRTLVALGAELQLKTAVNVPEDAVETPDIGSMADSLAARLKDNPDDLEGWMMLARTYIVLGEPAKVREAMENAVRLAPDNPEVLTLRARAIRDANGGEDNEESIAILRRILELVPDNTDALWLLGNAEAAAGNEAAARELLERLHAKIPEDSPDKEFVRQRIEQLGG